MKAVPTDIAGCIAFGSASMKVVSSATWVGVSALVTAVVGAVRKRIARRRRLERKDYVPRTVAVVGAKWMIVINLIAVVDSA